MSICIKLSKIIIKKNFTKRNSCLEIKLAKRKRKNWTSKGRNSVQNALTLEVPSMLQKNYLFEFNLFKYITEKTQKIHFHRYIILWNPVALNLQSDPIGPNRTQSGYHRTPSDPIGPHRTQSDPIGIPSDPIGPSSFIQSYSFKC
jgi:hypothetical protein